MKRFAMLVFATSLVLGTAADGKLRRLSEAELVHWDALRVWMDKKEQKAFLKLKTEDERNAWLKARGYWDRFYQYDKNMRDEIMAGNVRVGWTQDRVYMAWGPPHQKKRLPQPGAERTEALVYLLEVTPEGGVLVWEPGSKETHGAVNRYRYEVIVADGKVVEMIRKQGWDY